MAVMKCHNEHYGIIALPRMTKNLPLEAVSMPRSISMLIVTLQILCNLGDI